MIFCFVYLSARERAKFINVRMYVQKKRQREDKQTTTHIHAHVLTEERETALPSVRPPRQPMKNEKKNVVLFCFNTVCCLLYIGFFPSFISASLRPEPRGGVTGRLLFNDGVFVFFSDGFKI